MMASTGERYWLVKSGGRILGPMTEDQVIQSLRNKEIVVLDEISLSFGRWHYIRDEKVFELVVNEMRNPKSTAESTITGTSDLTNTDVTERLSSAFGPVERLTSNINEQRNETRYSNLPLSNKNNSVVYGYSKDKDFFSSRLPKTNVFIWISLIIVVSGISLKVISSRGIITPSSSDFLERAKKDMRIGNYTESAKEFRQVYNKTNDDAQIALDFAGMLLNLRQSGEARKVLESVSAMSASTKQKSKALTGIAVGYIQDYNYPLARKTLEEALRIQPDNAQAFANLGTIELFESKYADAEKALLNALDHGSDDPAVTIQLAEASFLNSKSKNLLESLLRSKVVLESSVKNSQNYHQEALAYRLHIGIETKETTTLEAIAIQFLNNDPQLTDDHIQDPYIARERVQWDHIVKYLKSSIGSNSKNPYLLAALGLATFKGRNKTEGKKIIEDVHSRVPDDTLIRIVLSYVQLQTGLREEGLVGLSTTKNELGYSLPLILQARYCREKKDFSCTEENWNKMLAQNEKSIVALAGKAWLEIDKGRLQEARPYISKGFALDPDYIPLLQAEEYLKGHY